MEQKGLLVEDKEVRGESCHHHWIIDYPEGPVSRGACRLCGEQREFKNSTEGSLREDNIWSHSLTDNQGNLDPGIPLDE